MSRRLAVIFCLLWCVLLIQFVREKQPFAAETKDLIVIMDELGLESLEANIELTGELGRSFSKRRVEQVLRAAAYILGMESTSEIISEERTNGTIWSIGGFLAGNLPDNTAWRGDIKVFAVQDGFFADYYFQAKVTGNGLTGQVTRVYERMETVKREQGLDSLVCLRVSGSCGTLLSQTQKEQLVNSILKEMDAKQVKETGEGNLSMFYAYNKKLGETVGIGSEQVNLNILLRDNGSVTRCFAGIPVVTSDD